MVREITMFELHFDGAHFGPTVGGDEDSEAAADDSPREAEDAPEESGGSKLRPLLAVVGIVLVLAALRRFAQSRSDDEEVDISVAEERESVTPEQ